MQCSNPLKWSAPVVKCSRVWFNWTKGWCEWDLSVTQWVGLGLRQKKEIFPASSKSRRAFHVLLCFSINEKILPSSDRMYLLHHPHRCHHHLQACSSFPFLPQLNSGCSLFFLKGCWVGMQCSDQLKAIQIKAFQDGSARTPFESSAIQLPSLGYSWAAASATARCYFTLQKEYLVIHMWTRFSASNDNYLQSCAAGRVQSTVILCPHDCVCQTHT